MSIIDRIKRLLGLAGDDTDDPSGAVTIEREPGAESSTGEPTPATETEAAVKGTDAGAAAPDATDPDATVESAAADGTDAAPGTVHTDDDTDTETADAVDTDETESGERDETGGDDGDGSDPGGGPVAEIKGIGPAYSDRLAEAGVQTVGDLAAADAEAVAAATELSEKRVSTWIDRASDQESA